MISPAPALMNALSPELLLACACCRVRPRPDDLVTISRLAAAVEPVRFVDLVVRRHRVGPLVESALRLCPGDEVAQLIELLAPEVRRNNSLALRAVVTHARLARWFRDAGIEWLVFKGITLAQRYYGDVRLRQVNDLDFLVDESDVERARAVLAQQGFHWDPVQTGWDLVQRGPRHRRYLIDYVYEEEHRSAEHGLLELHWRLGENSHAFSTPRSELMARGERMKMGDTEVTTMAPVDLLLYLCEHGGRHGWYRLKWLADLPQLLDSVTWDWEAVLNEAQRVGSKATLLLGLALAVQLFGWAPPPVVAGQLRGRLVSWQRSLAITGLLAPETWWYGAAGMPLSWRLRLIAYRCSLLPGWRAWGAQLWRLALSPNDLRVASLPDRFFGLYRWLRPALVLRRYLQRVP